MKCVKIVYFLISAFFFLESGYLFGQEDDKNAKNINENKSISKTSNTSKENLINKDKLAVAQKVYLSENDHLICISPNPEISQYMQSILHLVQNKFNQLNIQGALPTKKALVQIIEEPNYKYKLFHQGEMIMNISWSENLQIEDFFEALVEVNLYQNMFYALKKYNNKKIPLWIKQALSQELLLSQRPALREVFIKKSLSSKITLAQILNQNANSSLQIKDEDEMKIMSWTLLFSIRSVLSKDKFSNFLFDELSYENQQEVFKKYFNCLNNSQENVNWQMWFEVLKRHYLSLTNYFYSPEASREKLVSLFRVYALAEDGFDRAYDLSLLLSDNENLKISISKNALELSLLMRRINPVYLNPAITLGRIFELAIKNEEDENSSSNTILQSEIETLKKEMLLAYKIEKQIQNYDTSNRNNIK